MTTNVIVVWVKEQLEGIDPWLAGVGKNWMTESKIGSSCNEEGVKELQRLTRWL